MHTQADVGIIDEIFAQIEARGGTAYVGEPVSVAEHMLQSALTAEQDGAGHTLITAALLHDYGHLLHDLSGDVATQGIDTRHEDLAFEVLAPNFVPAVVEPIRLHVAAKRYLCAIDPSYTSELSAASMFSLALQGGPMTAAEAQAFARSLFAGDAVRLRRYDDVAKIPEMQTPDFEHYRPLVERSLCSGNTARAMAR